MSQLGLRWDQKSETVVLSFAFSSFFIPFCFLSFYPFDLHFLKIILSKLQVYYGRTKFLKRVSISYSGKAQEQRDGNRARPMAAMEWGMGAQGWAGCRQEQEGARWSQPRALPCLWVLFCPCLYFQFSEMARIYGLLFWVMYFIMALESAFIWLDDWGSFFQAYKNVNGGFRALRKIAALWATFQFHRKAGVVVRELSSKSFWDMVKQGKGLPRWQPLGKEHACQCRRYKRCGSIPGLGRAPGGGQGNPLQFLAWRIPWTEEPGGLPSIGLHRFGHDWSSLACTQSRGKSATLKLVLCLGGMCVWFPWRGMKQSKFHSLN